MTDISIKNQIEAIGSVKAELIGKVSNCKVFFKKALDELRKEPIQAPQKLKHSAPYGGLKIGSTLAIIVGGVGLAISFATKDKEWLGYASGAILTVGIGGTVFAGKQGASARKPDASNAQTYEVDFEKLGSILYAYISKLIKEINQKWNDCVDSNRKAMSDMILASGLSEEKKSALLADAAVSVSPEISMSDFSLRLEQLCTSQDELGLRQFISDFQNKATKEVNRLYDEQMKAYGKIKQS